jgi:O-antigen biosynthesis protein
MGEGTLAGAVVVLGMHRSGTSALTRGLKVLGIELGDNLKPPVSGDNDKGFFEDAGLSRINDELLHLWGGSWDSLNPGCNDPQAPAVRALSLKASEIIRDQYGSVAYFAFKDPRTARNLPFWKLVFDHIRATTYYVIVFRNPLSTARSLAARDGFPYKKSYYLWLMHMLDAVCGTENERRVFVEYDNLLVEPDTQLIRIANFIDDPRVNISYPEARAYSDDFLENRLRHHTATEEDLALDPACPSLVREAYRLLRLHARLDAVDIEPDTKAAWHNLRDAFRHVATFGTLIDQLDAERQQWLAQASKAQAHAEELRLNLAEAEAKRADGEARKAQRQACEVAHQQTVAGLSAQISALTESLNVRNGELAALRDVAQQKEKQVSTLIQSMAAREADIKTLQQSLEARQAQLDAAPPTIVARS